MLACRHAKSQAIVHDDGYATSSERLCSVVDVKLSSDNQRPSYDGEDSRANARNLVPACAIVNRQFDNVVTGLVQLIEDGRSKAKRAHGIDGEV